MSHEDKELIRLAAKAFFGGEDEAAHAIVSLGWNPLASNEDAFMTAVWVGMNIEFAGGWAHAFAAGREHSEIAENAGDDRYSAMRRAITRAAATVGAGLP